MVRRSIAIAAACCAAVGVGAQQSSAPPPAAQTQAPTPAKSSNLGADANGNPLRLAFKTGHVSNYDESKVPPYTLPDPLKFADGSAVRDANAWTSKRRPEILKLYETEIYGRIPAGTPKVTWRVAETDPAARDGAAVMKRVLGRIGDGDAAPEIKLTVHTPAKATGPVPLILLVTFGGGAKPPVPAEPPVAAEILARGWGYATVGYADIQPDRADSFTEGVIGKTLASGQQKPAADEWGTISAWAWGISRILDYFETDRAIDAKQVAVHGHS
ncbi:MAG TPA: hypothetical protein VFJ02_15915, partial [Vicinamibacterales bacterium]|nr:hypothetical protein [Vicinamibacterales bacterium]